MAEDEKTATERAAEEAKKAAAAGASAEQAKTDAEAKAEAERKAQEGKTFTEAEFQAEVDRRVTQALKTQGRKQREELALEIRQQIEDERKQKEEEAKLSAQQKLEKLESERDVLKGGKKELEKRLTEYEEKLLGLFEAEIEGWTDEDKALIPETLPVFERLQMARNLAKRLADGQRPPLRDFGKPGERKKGGGGDEETIEAKAKKAYELGRELAKQQGGARESEGVLPAAWGNQK